jgi:hypothetical protein
VISTILSSGFTTVVIGCKYVSMEYQINKVCRSAFC